MRKLLTTLSFLLVSSLITTSTLAQLPQRPPPAMKLSDPLPANLFVELSKIINPAIVNISTSVIPRGGAQMRDPMLDMLERLYGMPMGPDSQGPQGQPVPRQMGLGTGFIIREDGLILTNNHVIENADLINVQIAEGSTKTYEAKVIGSDKRTDIALIKITTNEKLPFVSLGSSKDVEVGEWVAAFGNPFGHGHSMTKGIISSKGREIGEINKIPLLQTDASINPGNSGGPLVNTKGYVIGVNSAIDARAQGIGFAIPIDEVKALLPQLETNGSIKRGYIGIGPADLDPQAAAYMGLSEDEGAVVASLDPKGPAVRAGIKPYDVIVEFNGKKIRSANDFVDAVADAPVGKDAKVKVVRGQETMTLVAKIADRPDERKLRRAAPAKKYAGQKVPFGIGMTVMDANDEIRAEWGFPPEMKNPIVIELERNSLAAKAGFRVGDAILDVNKKTAGTAKDVIKQVKKNLNTFRIARGGQILILSLETK